MASKRKKSQGIDPIQRELIEKAQSRARQKRRLYQHFILFLIGAALMILLNIVFNVGQNYRPLGMDWFVWAILLWTIIFFFHAFNVLVTNKFLGKEWEKDQVERLVRKQQKRIEELRTQVEKDLPIPSKKELRTTTPTPNPQPQEPQGPKDKPQNPNQNLNS